MSPALDLVILKQIFFNLSLSVLHIFTISRSTFIVNLLKAFDSVEEVACKNLLNEIPVVIFLYYMLGKKFCKPNIPNALRDI